MQSRHQLLSAFSSLSPDPKAAVVSHAPEQEWSGKFFQAIVAGEPLVFGGLSAWLQSRLTDRRGAQLVVFMDKAFEVQHPQRMDFLRYIDGWHHSLHLIQTAIKHSDETLLRYAGQYIDWQDEQQQKDIFNICGMYDGNLLPSIMSMVGVTPSKRAKGGWWRARTLARKRREVWLGLRGRSSFDRCVALKQFAIAKVLLDVGCVSDQHWNHTFDRSLRNNNIDAIVWMWEQERMQRWMEYIIQTQRLPEHFVTCSNMAIDHSMEALNYHMRRIEQTWGCDMRQQMQDKHMSCIPSAQFCQSVASSFEHARTWGLFHAFGAEIDQHFLYACQSKKIAIVAGLWPFVSQQAQRQSCQMLTVKETLAYPDLWTALNALTLMQEIVSDNNPDRPRRML